MLLNLLCIVSVQLGFYNMVKVRWKWLSQARMVQSTSAIPDKSSRNSVVEEHAVTVLAAPVSKNAKLFNFINARLRENTSTTIDK